MLRRHSNNTKKELHLGGRSISSTSARISKGKKHPLSIRVARGNFSDRLMWKSWRIVCKPKSCETTSEFAMPTTKNAELLPPGEVSHNPRVRDNRLRLVPQLGLKKKKNLVRAHGNGDRALCKWLYLNNNNNKQRATKGAALSVHHLNPWPEKPGSLFLMLTWSQPQPEALRFG